MVKKKSTVNVVGMVGFKDGEFISEISGPDIEPWFVVNRRCFSDSIAAIERSCFTKDAKLYYSTTIFYSTASKLSNLTWESDPLNFSNFHPHERALVKEAIERYVGEMAGRN